MIDNNILYGDFLMQLLSICDCFPSFPHSYHIFPSRKQLYNHKCLFICPSVRLFVRLSVINQNPSTATNHHPSSFNLHSSSFNLHPSSFFIHPSSFFIHPSFLSRLLSFSACFRGINHMYLDPISDKK